MSDVLLQSTRHECPGSESIIFDQRLAAEPLPVHSACNACELVNRVLLTDVMVTGELPHIAIKVLRAQLAEQTYERPLDGLCSERQSAELSPPSPNCPAGPDRHTRIRGAARTRPGAHQRPTESPTRPLDVNLENRCASRMLLCRDPRCMFPGTRNTQFRLAELSLSSSGFRLSRSEDSLSCLGSMKG